MAGSAYQSFFFTPRPPIVEARQYTATDSREQGYILGWFESRMNPGVTVTPDTTGDGFTIESSPLDADQFSLHVMPGDWILLQNAWPTITTLDDIHERFMPVGTTP